MTPPPYHAVVEEKAGKKVTPLIVERSIIRAWKREWSENPESCPYWHEDVYTFHPKLAPMKVSGWAQHMLRYQAIVLPNVEINSWIVKMWLDFQKLVFQEKRKIGNFIGSKNSGKSNFFAIIGHLLLSVDPQHTRVFVSGPYKTAADATIWGRFETRLQNMKAADKEEWEHVEFVASRGRITYADVSGEAGYIELITLDKVGKLQGTKSLDPEKGWLLLICDEIAEFPSAALLDALDNLTGNDNFICLTGCNFKNIEGLEGDLCRPEGREYAELHPDIDHDWPSNYKSWTFRYDGHLSPNILAGEVVSKYLLKEGTRQDMEDTHGKNGPKYLEQIRSFPNSSMSDYFVTTKDKIRAGGGYDEFVWDGASPTTCAFCDPGFGGDPCRIGAFRFGNARIQTTDGQYYTGPIFEPVGPIETIRIDTTLQATDEWVRRVMEVTGGDLVIRRDAFVTPEQQIAIACSDFLTRHNVPKSHFGYDGSMRASIVHEMVAILGTSVISMDFGGKASDRAINVKGTLADAEYFNFVTEMYFAFASLVQAGQFRGGDLVPAAIAQIVRRPWSITGTRKQIQPKEKYKQANQGRSPDDADTLVGALEVATRLGFRTFEKRRVTEPSVDIMSFAATLQGMELFRSPATKRLNHTV
jgi:hypothetical protein